MIKSTIVIPNYNGIRYIQTCLESLYSGTAKEFEVIVVDNASTDGSMEIVRDRFPQVRLSWRRSWTATGMGRYFRLRRG